MEDAVREGIKAGLEKVKEAGQANDQAIHFSESGETKDFGGIISVKIKLVFGGQSC